MDEQEQGTLRGVAGEDRGVGDRQSGRRGFGPGPLVKARLFLQAGFHDPARARAPMQLALETPLATFSRAIRGQGRLPFAVLRPTGRRRRRTEWTGAATDFPRRPASADPVEIRASTGTAVPASKPCRAANPLKVSGLREERLAGFRLQNHEGFLRRAPRHRSCVPRRRISRLGTGQMRDVPEGCRLEKGILRGTSRDAEVSATGNVPGAVGWPCGGQKRRRLS